MRRFALAPVFAFLAIAPLAAQPTIVETAVKAGAFNTLVQAVKAADLVETLSGKGPFTVFAPTDEAFAQLPEGTLATLLKPENKAQLASILTFHVVPGAFDAKAVLARTALPSAQGQRLPITMDGKTPCIAGAAIVKTDIRCGNGIIHVIDRVVLPTDQNIVQVAKGAGSFNTLLKAATEAGLAPALMKDGPFTVFAPSDEAFAKLPEGTVSTLLKPENKERLAAILKAHVVKGRVYSDQAVAAKKASTLGGYEVQISKGDAGVIVSGARVVAPDIEAENGVIHVIDTVIIPGAK